MDEHRFAYDFERYRKFKELTSGLLIAHIIDAYDGLLDSEQQTNVALAIIEITRCAKKFEVVRWMEIQNAINELGGIAAEASDFKVLAMSSAGRLLITISDTLSQGRGKFGGGWISLIGEDSNPGGMNIQGLCATKEEALGLLNAAIDRMPKIKASKSYIV